MVEVKINGLSDLRAALLKLPQALDRKVLNGALSKGAILMRNKSRSNASAFHRTGTLERNIRSRTGRPREGMTATVIVGVRKLSNKQVRQFKMVHRKGGRANPNDPFYWRFMEFGFTDRGGKWHAGKSFLRNAFETTKFAAVDAITIALRERIAKEAEKLRR